MHIKIKGESHAWKIIRLNKIAYINSRSYDLKSFTREGIGRDRYKSFSKRPYKTPSKFPVVELSGGSSNGAWVVQLIFYKRFGFLSTRRRYEKAFAFDFGNVVCWHSGERSYHWSKDSKSILEAFQIIPLS